ncbi:hypothetical protein [Psychromonas ossibalaenae]|uniref:hypothetical protein n=1 Tax=Psychromonas ossibalaenae TaxID=444922 RepID=UPI00036D7156|nr:hypothetical protein [Psychromonas ossibalaenae]
MAKAGKHERNFDRAADDMDEANNALDEGKYIKAGYYASVGIAKPIIGVAKDPVGFLVELIKG